MTEKQLVEKRRKERECKQRFFARMTPEQKSTYWKEKHANTYKKNPEKYAHRGLAAYHELRRKVFEKLGKRCNNPQCKRVNNDGSTGCLDVRCLQIDHVKGDGVEDRKKVGVSATFLRKVLKDEINLYQLLCSNCNWIKRVENREY